MTTTKNWFTVDKAGLRALQKGKSKTFIINELVQNAFDQNITFCKVDIHQITNSEIYISVVDDDPNGFSNIAHAYTLFADTYKRRDPTKRGRFNLGEKQVISICDWATVKTTKGTIRFDDKGRTELPEKTDKGSIIEIAFHGNKKDFTELLEHTKLLVAPSNVQFIVNNDKILPKTAFKAFEASLDTEVLEDDIMVQKFRKTAINLYEPENQSYIYEMGIPIMKIDCPWSIDIQQKIPLAVDRETVRSAFIQDVYAETLNYTYMDIKEEDSSALWIRKATKDKRTKKDAIKEVLNKRFGDKFVSRNPFDPNANDEALANGYNVISGNQMSSEEWERIRENNLIKSSSDVFGAKGIACEKEEKPTPKQVLFSMFARRVAKEYLNVELIVRYVKSNDTARAYYGGQSVTFNLSRLPANFFDKVGWKNIKLLLHELGHEKGNHTEHSYHDCITTMSGKLVIKALEDPTFFEVE